jgi:hypothetical protein
MALLEIPVPSNNEAFRLRADLEGATYEMEFVWSTRALQFTLTIRDATGTDLLTVPVVGNYDLLKRFQNELLPPGNLVCFDISNAQREPTLTGFGNEFKVWYQESA